VLGKYRSNVIHSPSFPRRYYQHLPADCCTADDGGRSLAGTAGSNPARGMDVGLLWVLCVVR